MTSETTDAPVEALSPLARAGVAASYQHIELLNRKREQLAAVQVEAEEQFLHRLRAAYNEGRITEEELALTYAAYARIAVTGFAARWWSGIGAHHARMQYIARSVDRSKPNMPDGTWRGSSPLAEGDHMPRRGQSVVYVLYDAANEPCYVGSTQHLLVRLQGHRNDKKAFTWWTAFPCADREAAYQLEERLLSEYKPYLNKKRSR